jgi:hypothetical protein
MKDRFLYVNNYAVEAILLCGPEFHWPLSVAVRMAAKSSDISAVTFEFERSQNCCGIILNLPIHLVRRRVPRWC